MSNSQNIGIDLAVRGNRTREIVEHSINHSQNRGPGILQVPRSGIPHSLGVLPGIRQGLQTGPSPRILQGGGMLQAPGVLPGYLHEPRQQPQLNFGEHRSVMLPNSHPVHPMPRPRLSAPPRFINTHGSVLMNYRQQLAQEVNNEQSLTLYENVREERDSLAYAKLDSEGFPFLLTTNYANLNASSTEYQGLILTNQQLLSMIQKNEILKEVYGKMKSTIQSGYQALFEESEQKSKQIKAQHDELIECRKQLQQYEDCKKKVKNLLLLQQRLPKARNDYKTQLKQANQEIQVHISENESLRKKMQEKVEEISFTNTRLIDTEADNQLKNKRIEKQMFDLSKLHAENEQLKNAFHKVEEEKQKLHNEITNITRALENKKKDHANMSMMLQECTTDNTTLMREKVDYVEKIDNLERAKADLCKQREHQDQVQSILQRDNRVLHDQVETLKTKFDSTVSKYEARVKQLESSINENKVVEFTASQSHTDEITDISNRLSDVIKQMAKKESELQEERKQNEQLTNCIDELNRRDETLRTNVDVQTAEFRKLEERYKNQKQETDNWRKASERYKEEFECAKKLREKQVEDCAKQRVQNVRFCKEIKELQERNVMQKKEIVTWEQKGDAYMLEIGELKAHNVTQSQKLTQLTADRDTYKNETMSLNKRNEKLCEEAEKLREDGTKFKQKNDRLNKELQLQKDEIAIIKKDAKKLEEEITKLKLSEIKLRNETKRLIEQFAKDKDQLQKSLDSQKEETKNWKEMFEDTQLKLEQLSKKYDQCVFDAQTQNDIYINDINKLNDMIVDLKGVVEDLQSSSEKYSVCKQNCNVLIKERKGLDAEIIQLKAELERLILAHEKELEKMKQENDRLRAQIAELKHEIENIKLEQVEEKQKMTLVIESKSDELNARNNEHEKLKRKMKLQYEQHLMEINDYKATLLSHKDQIRKDKQSIKNEKQVHQEEISKLNTKLEKQRQTIDDLKKQNDTLQTESESRLAEISVINATLKNHIKTADKQKKESELMTQDLVAKLAEQDKELEKHKSEIKKQQLLLNQQEKRCENLEEEARMEALSLEQHKVDIKTLDRKIEHLILEENTLNKELKRVNRKVEELKYAINEKDEMVNMSEKEIAELKLKLGAKDALISQHMRKEESLKTTHAQHILKLENTLERKVKLVDCLGYQIMALNTSRKRLHRYYLLQHLRATRWRGKSQDLAYKLRQKISYTNSKNSKTHKKKSRDKKRTRICFKKIMMRDGSIIAIRSKPTVTANKVQQQIESLPLYQRGAGKIPNAAQDANNHVTWGRKTETSSPPGKLGAVDVGKITNDLLQFVKNPQNNTNTPVTHTQSQIKTKFTFNNEKQKQQQQTQKTNQDDVDHNQPPNRRTKLQKLSRTNKTRRVDTQFLSKKASPEAEAEIIDLTFSDDDMTVDVQNKAQYDIAGKRNCNHKTIGTASDGRTLQKKKLFENTLNNNVHNEVLFNAKRNAGTTDYKKHKGKVGEQNGKKAKRNSENAQGPSKPKRSSCPKATSSRLKLSPPKCPNKPMESDESPSDDNQDDKMKP